MRIAISLFDGNVSEVYELSHQISLYALDFENGTIADEGTHAFPGLESSLEWFAEREVEALLTGSIDPDNAMQLGQGGTQVFTGADDISPADNAKRFLALVQEAIQHGHGGCGCGGHCHDDADEEAHECGGEGCCNGEGEDDHECCGGAGHDDPNHVCRCH